MESRFAVAQASFHKTGKKVVIQWCISYHSLVNKMSQVVHLVGRNQANYQSTSGQA
ncbi:hypothetical protein WMZ97_17625 [Lentibacillus sp. N15]|uniref:hypothetical protein n=1 Tax=Lentibacillus songyuanensis TaxID=3136161 RepID=UPI0031BB2A13